MQLDYWASRWKIPPAAVKELLQIFNLEPNDAPPQHHAPTSEAGVQSAVRLEASRKGIKLWRNNVGATFTDTGSFIRFGLANESKAVNEIIKSADLIGIRPLKITAGMIGHTLGQFVCREIKPFGWKYSATDREKAQLQWAKLIQAHGGDAGFATREGTL